MACLAHPALDDTALAGWLDLRASIAEPFALVAAGTHSDATAHPATFHDTIAMRESLKSFAGLPPGPPSATRDAKICKWRVALVLPSTIRLGRGTPLNLGARSEAASNHGWFNFRVLVQHRSWSRCAPWSMSRYNTVKWYWVAS